MESYESLGPVGEGSYGTVLKCRHRESGRLVAIKKFMDSDEDKTVKKIALREIKLLRQLRHDNLVNLLMVWKRRRRWYLVFEFVDRTLLEDLEQNPNGLDLNTCRQYMFQILRAATFCHQQNVIHRDIKPENILISQEGVVKLCDFGFARTIASPSEVYTDYVATRWYRAPELLVGDIKYGKPVDVWALGCLLIEVLTGQPLFPGDSDLDQIYHIVKCFGNLVTHHQELFYRNPIFSGVKLPESSSTVPLQQRFPSITQNALDVAQRCLEMDPEGRAQCSELLDHLFFTQDSFHIRCGDKPQQHGGAYDREVQKFTTGHVTGSFTCQVPEHRLMSEKAKNKPHVHFPDVRGSALPDLKEGKPNKASIRNVRKETNPVSSSLVSDVQQQQGPNINTNTPQK
nr:cyclin-dependent kinase-like 2 isoform X1 [Nothobranchius furzeri]